MVTDECAKSGDEGSSGKVDIAYNVERQSVKGENEHEERQIRRQLQEVFDDSQLGNQRRW